MNEKEKQTSRLSSKFWRTILTLFSTALIFIGPTYAVLVLWRGLDIDYALSMASGFILFLIGFSLLIFLIKKKIVS
ncbi:MAG: hypothetical protein QXU46_05140 [Candidatus Bathyarchaeia archaeon]